MAAPARRPTWPKRAAAAVAVAALAFAGKLLVDAGAFRVIAASSTLEGCETLDSPALAGAEDVEITPEGWAILSEDPRDGERSGSGSPGALYMLDLARKPLSPVKVELPPALAADFRPHGISLAPGGTRLFAINHRADRDTVEVFRVAGPGLQHLRTIEAPSNGNDLAAVDDDRFYYTRDHEAAEGLGQAWENYSRMGRGSVAYYDGRGFRTVAERLSYANGILASADGATIWVGAMLERAIHEYRRDPATGSLEPSRVIDVGFGVDNLSLASDGSLLVAGHPKLLSVNRMKRDRGSRSPSMVVRMPASGGGAATTVLSDPGERIAASSVATEWRGRWVIGSVFDHRVLVCQDRPPQQAGGTP